MVHFALTVAALGDAAWGTSDCHRLCVSVGFSSFAAGEKSCSLAEESYQFIGNVL